MNDGMKLLESLKRLEKMADEHAGGSFTIFKFSSGYKVMFSIPPVEQHEYLHIGHLLGATDPKEAIDLCTNTMQGCNESSEKIRNFSSDQIHAVMEHKEIIVNRRKAIDDVLSTT